MRRPTSACGRGEGEGGSCYIHPESVCDLPTAIQPVTRKSVIGQCKPCLPVIFLLFTAWNLPLDWNAGKSCSCIRGVESEVWRHARRVSTSWEVPVCTFSTLQACRPVSFGLASSRVPSSRRSTPSLPRCSRGQGPWAMEGTPPCWPHPLRASHVGEDLDIDPEDLLHPGKWMPHHLAKA